VEGLKACDTQYVAVAEHDCLYSNEHFRHVPLAADTFDYNKNCWLVQWKSNHPELDGMYSYWRRRLAQSQVVCWRESLLQAVTERLALVDAGLRGFRWAGEMGTMSPQTWDVVKTYAHWFDSGNPNLPLLLRHSALAASGKPCHLIQFVEEHVTKWKHRTFVTAIPNLDIRHQGNFTGPKRGKLRRYDLPYWGRFADLIGEASLHA